MMAIIYFMLMVGSALSSEKLSSFEDGKSIQDVLEKLQTTVENIDKKVESNTNLLKKLDSSVSRLRKEYCSTIPENACGPCQCIDDNRLLEKYYCDCQNLQPKRDCLEFHKQGLRVNGVYKIHQNNLKIIQVFCDQTTDKGGWTVFQRRTDGSVKFYRDWATYKKGFGNLQNEFWLGNTNIFTMSYQGLLPAGNELRIDLEDWEGQKRYAKYSTFQVGSATTKYQLNLGGYEGDAGDGGVGMSSHNGNKFSTFDNDNDSWTGGNCAMDYYGGWWYNNCHYVNINGKYYDYGHMGGSATGVHWYPFHGHDYPLKKTEMKMRRKS